MSKYNVGDKFIIELAQEYHIQPGEARAQGEGITPDVNLYRVKGFAALTFNDYGLDKLEKLPDPEPEKPTANGFVTLTRGEAYSLANHIDQTLIQSIRNDVDMDSMEWLRNIIHAYEKLCKGSGYVGLTESDPADDIEADELPY